MSRLEQRNIHIVSLIISNKSLDSHLDVILFSFRIQLEDMLIPTTRGATGQVIVSNHNAEVGFHDSPYCLIVTNAVALQGHQDRVNVVAAKVNLFLSMLSLQ